MLLIHNTVRFPLNYATTKAKTKLLNKRFTSEFKFSLYLNATKLSLIW